MCNRRPLRPSTSQSCLNPCSNGICVKAGITEFPRSIQRSLNPCSNGICVKVPEGATVNPGKSLNPCSNGICVKVFLCVAASLAMSVLILVLMEYV